MSKHKNARIFAAVLAAGSFLCFQPSLIKAKTTSEAENQQNIQGEEELPTLQDHRNALANSNYICEIVFLGYLGEHSGKLSEDRTFLNQFLDDSGYMDAFSFVKDLPDEQIVEIENGHELYCIFPVDPNASVAVNEYLINESNGFYGETGDVLYKSETGEPILLRCNVSDIIRDSEVNIVDSQGRVLTWQFGISLNDGSVICPVTEPYAFDASYLNVSEESYAHDDDMEYQGTEGDCGDYNWAEEESESGVPIGDMLYEYNEDSMFMEMWISCEDLLNCREVVFEFEKDGYKVIACRDREFEEDLRVGCYKDGNQVWGYMTSVFSLSELNETEIFLAGLDTVPKLVIFNSYMGMYMIDPVTGVIDWKIEEPDLPLTGSLSYMIDGFGNMFLKGKYDVDVIKITMDGIVAN